VRDACQELDEEGEAASDGKLELVMSPWYGNIVLILRDASTYEAIGATCCNLAVMNGPSLQPQVLAVTKIALSATDAEVAENDLVGASMGKLTMRPKAPHNPFATDIKELRTLELTLALTDGHDRAVLVFVYESEMSATGERAQSKFLDCVLLQRRKEESSRLTALNFHLAAALPGAVDLAQPTRSLRLTPLHLVKTLPPLALVPASIQVFSRSAGDAREHRTAATR
jgi:hypothetical protein